MSKRIFLSYRRDDSQDETDRLYQFLCQKFGTQHVFRDLDTIRKGFDFVEIIEKNLQSCAAAVVIIGDKWLNIKDSAGKRRLENPGDYVRLEIAAVLERDIPVIPLLIRGEQMPEGDSLPNDLKPLVRRQIAILRDSQFESDAEYLTKELEAALGFYHGQLSRNIMRGLKVLRERIGRAKIPASQQGSTLNLATWNIRQLGHKDRRKASLHYIAEILSQFDIIGVSEAEKYQGDLRKIQLILGPFWKVFFSGGFCFISDSRKVEFGGIARQITGFPTVGRHRHEAVELPFWRNPYLVSFRAGEREMILVLVHVRWGRNVSGRVKELAALSEWLDMYYKKELGENQNLIALGTFQTASVDDKTFKELTQFGLQVPNALQSVPGNNIRRDKVYQQILCYSGDAGLFSDFGGVLDFNCGDYKSGPEGRVETPLYPNVKLRPQDYLTELSDNLPLWVQLKVA
jgi:hypothetical protein